MSTGGVYQTDDGRASWRPANWRQGVLLPRPLARSSASACTRSRGTLTSPSGCICKTTTASTAPTTAEQQWVSIADGLPSDFGFPIVVDPNDADTVYVFPLVADGERIPPDGKPRVWRSRDAGESWTELGNGLPADGFYSCVMRDAMCADDADPTGLYIGTRDGTVFASNDERRHLADRRRAPA